MKHIVLFLCNLAFLIVVESKQPLYVGALLELSNHWYVKYVSFFRDIMEYALEEIENRTDILADYSLQLIIKDTQGQGGLAARKLFELVTEGPPIAAVLGPTLSSEMTVTGQISPYYHVVQMSYLSTSSTTVDRKKFSTLFKVNFVLDNLNPLRIKMMQNFNWTRVGTIIYQNEIDISQMNIFHELLKQTNMTLITSAVVTEDSKMKVQIARLKQYDVRIIMGSFHWIVAARIFCEAYKVGLYGSNYVWILSGAYMYDNWLYNSDLSDLDCKLEELLKATDGLFTLDYDLIHSENTTTISGKTPSEVTDILLARLRETDNTYSMYYGWVYDAVWALAVGLNNSLQHLNDSGFEGYVNSPYYLEAIHKGMHEVNFMGISGPVSFNELGGRVGVVYIEQSFNSTGKKVAKYNELTDRLTWIVPVEKLWPGGIIPKDRFIYRRVLVAPSISVQVLILTGNCVCFIIALGFLAFNIYYRNNSQIKLSSPMVNNVIIFGSILILMCVLLSSLDTGHLLSETTSADMCMVRVWIMCLGFTSLFGALFSKTWRVHIIFRDYRAKKTAIKDYHLFGMILFFLMIDFLLLIAWSLTHALEKESIVKNSKDFHNVSVVISEVYTFCHHPKENYWYISVYIYKGLLLVFGVFLTWETRNVTVPALNDSKYIGFCIYNVVIVCVFGVPLAHVLPREQTTLNFVLLSVLVMFCTTLCLCILFIPKTKLRNQIAGKFLNPSLNSTTTGTSSTAVTSTTSRPTTKTEPSQVSKGKEKSVEDTQATIEELQTENGLLRKQIAMEATAIARLKRDLLHFTGNIHFYKSGDDYIVFKADEQSASNEATSQQQQQPGEETAGTGI